MRGHLPLVAVVVEPLVLAVEDMEVVTMVAMEVVAVVALEVSGSSGGSLGHSGLVRRGLQLLSSLAAFRCKCDL
eukprot:s808_g7.t1